MARTIRLLISYDGTAYYGWQRQWDVPTIQGTLEEHLSTICNEPITLHGAGRTDAGVHALGMTAHFITNASPPVIAFLRGLNSLLPRDIRILDAQEVDREFHSRFSALGKTYRYDFFTGQIMPPCKRLYTAHFPGAFQDTTVHACLKLLIGSHDFSSFEGVGSRDPSNTTGKGAVRTLMQAELTKQEGAPGFWSLFLTGDGFLRHMVRNIVGTLVLAGKGKLGPADFQKIIDSQNRCAAGPTAPPCGLFLEKIYYNPTEFPSLSPIE